MATLGPQRDHNQSQGLGLMSRDYPSLFQADSDDECSIDSDSDHELLESHPSHLPIKELIHEAPHNLASLLDLLLPRLQPHAEVKGVSLQDQKNFMTVLVGELSSQFSIIHHQIDDPFLNPQQNKALHREIVIRVCEMIEELYKQYLIKAARIGTDSVFSKVVNLTRLKAELILEANKSLNILSIRRHILSQIRGALPSIDRDFPTASTMPRCRKPKLPPIPKQKVKPKLVRKMSLEDLKLDEPLKTKMMRFGVRLNSNTMRRRVKKLQARMATRPSLYQSNDDDDDAHLAECWEDDVETDTLSQKSRHGDVVFTTSKQLSRAPSMPELCGGFLLSDLGLARPANKEEEYSMLGIHRPSSVGQFLDLKLDENGTDQSKDTKHMGEYTAEELHRDIHDLQTMASSSETTGADELHPLLQAHGHGLSNKHAQRLARHDAELRRAAQEVTQESIEYNQEIGLDENSIPSVPTLDQLPDFNIEHVERASSSHHSMHVKSGLREINSQMGPPLFSSSVQAGSEMAVSQVLSEESFLGSSFARLDQSHINVGDVGNLVDEYRCDDFTSTQESQMFGPRREQFTHETVSQNDVTMLDALSQTEQLPPSQYSNITASKVTPDDLRKNRGEKERSLVDSSAYDGSVGGTDSACASNGVFPSGFSISSEFQVQPEEVAEIHLSLSPSLPTTHQAQPAVVTTRFQEHGVVRTSDIRVSERTPLNELKQKLFGPVYNHITGELDSSMIEELDSILNQESEIQQVYDEILNTLPKDDLDFQQEPMLEPTVNVPIEFSRILASDTLHHRRSRRIVNDSLYRYIPHPWAEGTSREDWERSNQYKGPDLDQLGINLDLGRLQSPHRTHITRAFVTWLKWWKSLINSEDYLKFVSTEESDYLRLVYHLYDSDGSDSEAEEELRARKESLERLHKKLKEKEAKRQKRYSDKNKYESGFWNVNTVIMGGLGGDPAQSSDEDLEVGADHHHTLLKQGISPEMVQIKMQEIWHRLHFPESQQMDMATKYSDPKISSQLDKVLGLWAQVCDMIEEREVLLSQLEAFEREASDPSRFFSKGARGSSVARLNEARNRGSLHMDLDRLDKQVSHHVKKLLTKYGDVVTYNGRPYSDKMSSDRTEMLYCLQQERRQTILKPALTTLTIMTETPSKCIT